MENHSVIYRALARRYEAADSDDINDALAVADTVIWQAREAGTAVRNADAFCTCVAKRVLGRAVRRKKRMVYPDHEEDPTDWDEIQRERGLPTVSLDPSDAIDAQEILESAPEKYAEVLRIHYLEGMSFEDAANELGVTPECLRKRHERALKWAKKYFVER